MRRNELGFFVPELDDPEGWAGNVAANWDRLRDLRPTGGLAVVARDVDTSTMLPTSRYYNITQGIYLYQGTFAGIGPFVGLQAPASTFVYVWLEIDGTAGQGPTFPVRAVVPLARVTCDGARIVEIMDCRAALAPMPAPLAVSRVLVAGGAYVQALGVSYIRADATTGPVTVTLGAPADYHGQTIVVRKADAGGNAVTIVGPIEGAPSLVLAARGAIALVSDGNQFEIMMQCQ